MQHRARALVLRSSVWRTELAIATERGKATSYSKSQLGDWKVQRKIFAISVNDEVLYPDYAFDFKHRFQPYPGLTLVIKILSEKKDDWGIAYWFASANRWLGGARPQDMLAVDPARVIAAARIETMGITHG